jgi:hypothetical protein
VSIEYEYPVTGIVTTEVIEGLDVKGGLEKK